VSASPCRKPSRQVDHFGDQPSSRLALALDEPRICVRADTPTSPAANRASQTGTCRGGLAPTASASAENLRDRRRLVVDDVVDPAAVLERGNRRGRGVVGVHERPDRTAVAGDRHPPLADEFDHRVARPWAVEHAVTQDDALERRGHHCLLHVADRVERAALRLRRVRVQRIVLGLDGASGALVRPAGEALRHEPPDTGGARGRKQVVGAARPQLVGCRERAVEVAQVRRPGERGHLVDDRVRFGVGNRLSDRCRVETVDKDGLGAQVPEQAELRLTTGRCSHVMARHNQLRDEAAADGAGGTGDEYTHWVSPSCGSFLACRTGDEIRAPHVTPGGRCVVQVAKGTRSQVSTCGPC
jgi:hypothetical protein